MVSVEVSCRETQHTDIQCEALTGNTEKQHPGRMAASIFKGLEEEEVSKESFRIPITVLAVGHSLLKRAVGL